MPSLIVVSHFQTQAVLEKRSSVGQRVDVFTIELEPAVLEIARETRSGRNVTRGVMRRLREAGFSRIVRRPRAFGVVAFK